MAKNILAKRIEIRIVHRAGWYFYNRIENGIEVVECQSISRERAQQIYEANQSERQIVEGQPFGEDGQPWAWSAWPTIEEATDDD